MRRGISSKAALVANIAVQQSNRAIENAGGFFAPEQPNRELRRRMEREERKQRKREKKGESNA